MSKVPSLCWFLWIIARVTGEEGVLLHRLNSNASWSWLTRYELGKGSGWSRDSIEGSYVVCDIEVTKTGRPNSWLVSEFVPVEDAEELHVQLEFTVRQCPQNYPHCVNYFKLNVFEVDEPKIAGIDRETIENGSFAFVDVVNTTSVWLQGQHSQTNIVKTRLEVTKKGIYLGFQDVGACVALNKVTVTFKFCGKESLNGAIFEKTVAPLQSEKSTLVTGACVNHSSPLSGEPLTRLCLSNGEWKANGSLACVCNPGYEPAGDFCEGCQDGFFKSNQGNTACSPCPAYSASVPTRQLCSCQDGYFRAPDDPLTENCTRPPSQPIQLTGSIITRGVAVIRWSPPLDDGGRTDVTYDVKCSLCLMEVACTSGCTGMQFWPSNQRLEGRQVTLSNITSSGLYNLSVVAKNGVSDQNGSADLGSSASLVLFLETADSTSSPPATDEVINAHNTGSFSTATVVGISVAGTFLVCFIAAVIAVACLAKYWKKNPESLHRPKQNRDTNHLNGSTISTKTTTTDVSRCRVSLTTEDPISMRNMGEWNKPASEVSRVDTKNAENTVSAASVNGRMKKNSPRSVSPMLMKAWAGPPRG